MKIKEIFEQDVLPRHLLTEGVRFGRKEASMVINNKDILVGIEYEFHPHEVSTGVDLDAYHDQWIEQVDAYHDQWIEQELSLANDYIVELGEFLGRVYNFVEKSPLDVNDFEDLINEFENFMPKAISSSSQIQKLEKIIEENPNLVRTTFAKYNDVIQNLEVFLDEYEDIEKLSAVNYTLFMLEPFEDFDIEEIIQEGDRYLMPPEEVTPIDLFSSPEEMKETINRIGEYASMSGEILTLFAIHENKPQHGYESLVHTEYEKELENEFSSLLNSGEFDDELAERGDDSSTPDPEEAIKDALEDSNLNINSGDINNIQPEHDNQIEIITNPLPIKDSLVLMRKMHEFIGNEGYTDSSSGMHVNMSIKGTPHGFSNDDVNILKLFLFGDPKYLGRKYPVREYVHEIIDIHNPNMRENFLNLLSIMQVGRSAAPFELIERWVKNLIKTGTKYQKINFSHLFGIDYGTNTRRIEFRYFGGEDYEDNTEDLNFDILRTAYHLLLATNDDMYKKEYHKKIYQFVDKVSQAHLDMSFDAAKKLSPEEIKALLL